MLRIVALLILSVLLGLPSQAESKQNELLIRLIEQPVSSWQVTLNQSDCLDREFLDQCQARINWGLMNNLPGDALTFAVIGEMASRTLAEKDYLQRFQDWEIRIGSTYFHPDHK